MHNTSVVRTTKILDWKQQAMGITTDSILNYFLVQLVEMPKNSQGIIQDCAVLKDAVTTN
jgi:hypothetical protein